jgi:hypothetical protein
MRAGRLGRKSSILPLLFAAVAAFGPRLARAADSPQRRRASQSGRFADPATDEA